MFTRTRHISYPRLHKCSLHPSERILGSFLILSSHLHLLLSSGLFSPNFPAKTLYPSRLTPKCATCPVHLTLLESIIRVQNSAVCSFLHSPLTLSLLGPNIFLSTLFSSILNLYSFGVGDQISRPYRKRTALFFCTFNLYIIEKSEGRHKILDRMTAGVPPIQSALCKDTTKS